MFFGNIQRIDNFLEALPVRENNCKQKLEDWRNVGNCKS